MDAKKRLDWLDVSKAIGVYLVILGHLVMFNYHTFRFIFAFHMPFFFVAAGYVWKWNDKFGGYIKKISKNYLFPYFVVSVLGLVQCILLPMAGRNIGNLMRPEVLERSFYEGLPSYSFFGSAWFLLAMFWAQLFFWVMMWLAKRFKKYIVVLAWIVLVLFAVFSKDIFSFIPIFERLPWKLDSALMATVFMGIGYLLKKVKMIGSGKAIIAGVLSLAGAFITWLFGCKWNYYVNLCDCAYAKEYNYFIAAIAGSVMLFGLGQLLCKIKLLQYAGRNTLIIFLAHESIYVLVIYLVNMLFHQSLAGQSMPLNGWSIGVSLATFGLAILLVYIIEKIKKLSKKVFAKLH